MAKYVDGFVVPVPQRSRRVSPHGAQGGQDLARVRRARLRRERRRRREARKWTSFPRSVKLKRTRSCGSRRSSSSRAATAMRVNAKVMKDPRLAAMMAGDDAVRRQADDLRRLPGGDRCLTSTRFRRGLGQVEQEHLGSRSRLQPHRALVGQRRAVAGRERRAVERRALPRATCTHACRPGASGMRRPLARGEQARVEVARPGGS